MPMGRLIEPSTSPPAGPTPTQVPLPWRQDPLRQPRPHRAEGLVGRPPQTSATTDTTPRGDWHSCDRPVRLPRCTDCRPRGSTRSRSTTTAPADHRLPHDRAETLDLQHLDQTSHTDTSSMVDERRAKRTTSISATPNESIQLGILEELVNPPTRAIWLSQQDRCESTIAILHRIVEDVALAPSAAKTRLGDRRTALAVCVCCPNHTPKLGLSSRATRPAATTRTH